MGAPTVDFDSITVSLRDADNNPIPSRTSEFGGSIIKVIEGDFFSVCVDFGEVNGSGPGMYSVTISLSGMNEKGEYKVQWQVWCVTASFEGGVLQFKKFRSWNHSPESYTEGQFAMPKPGGHSPRSDRRGLIRVTIKRISEEYRAVKFEPRPEIPDDAVSREDLFISRDVYVANPYKHKQKQATRDAKNYAEFVFRNTEIAYGSDDDEPNKGRKVRRARSIPRTPEAQGLKPRAAATEAKRGLKNMKSYQAKLSQMLGSGDDSRLSPTQAYFENGIRLARSDKDQHQREYGAQARPSPEPEIGFKQEEEDDTKSNAEEASPHLDDGHTPQVDYSSSDDEGLFVPEGTGDQRCSRQHRADSVVTSAHVEEYGKSPTAPSAENARPASDMRELFGEDEEDGIVQDDIPHESTVAPSMQQDEFGERKRKREEESELSENMDTDHLMRANTPESPTDKEPQRKTNIPRATADSPEVRVMKVESEDPKRPFEQTSLESTPSPVYHQSQGTEDFSFDIDSGAMEVPTPLQSAQSGAASTMDQESGEVIPAVQAPQFDVDPTMNADPGEAIPAVQTARSTAPPTTTREASIPDKFDVAPAMNADSEEALPAMHTARSTARPTTTREPSVPKTVETATVNATGDRDAGFLVQNEAEKTAIAVAEALRQPPGESIEPGVERKIGVLARKIKKTEAKMRLHEVRSKNLGTSLEVDEQYHEWALEKTALELEKYELDGMD